MVKNLVLNIYFLNNLQRSNQPRNLDPNIPPHQNMPPNGWGYNNPLPPHVRGFNMPPQGMPPHGRGGFNNSPAGHGMPQMGRGFNNPPPIHQNFPPNMEPGKIQSLL